MSIRRRFFLGITVYALILALGAYFMGSWFVRRTMVQQNKEEARMALFAMKAVRAHVADVIRPVATGLLGPDRFLPELQSTSFAANAVFGKIPVEDRDGIFFRTASLKPRNPKNAASLEEAELINLLDKKKEAGEEPFYEGERNLSGMPCYVIAIGEVSKEPCMKCHGEPSEAPAGMKALYPEEGDRGYHHRKNRVESAEIVAIPLSDVDQKAGLVRLGVLAVSAAGLVLLLIGVSTGLNIFLGPLEKLSLISQEMAQGKLGEAREDLAAIPGKMSGAETQRLVEAFSIMAESLSELLLKVQEQSVQVATAASEIAASSRQIEKSVSGQAVSASEVLAESREIKSRSEEITREMGNLAADADGTAQMAGAGEQGIASMSRTMTELKEETGEIAERLSDISEKAKSINALTNAIAAVAQETNLLSLNAAIEAEKAGELGRGFSVVALEIRKLADRTSVAVVNIERMVSEVHASVRSGVTGMDRFVQSVDRAIRSMAEIGGSFSRVLENVRDFAPRFSQANAMVAAQSNGAQEISHAMEDLSETARQTESSVSEFNRAVGLLRDTADELKSEVSRFAAGPPAKSGDD
ncbi:MAG: methyl-accepting chemotaxis protein [Thermodesulfobacteriota bacterium]